jgi:hypothetical protein
MKRQVVINVDSEKGPELHYEGFQFAGEVVLLLQIAIQMLTEDLKDKMKSNLVKVAPAPFVTR